MRELPKDIIEEMHSRFTTDFDYAYKLLEDYLAESDDLYKDRIIRCVIYLTKDGITQLKKNLAAARQDPRDVMLWAEYDNPANPTRVRDFDKTFQENQ